MRKYQLIIFIFLFHFSIAQAQQGAVIRGNVTESGSGIPLPGVNVVELDEQNRIIKGTITDINGYYVLEVEDVTHTIRISFIGYDSESLQINGRENINVSLNPSTVELEQVTISADVSRNSLTGITDRDKTGSSVRVDMTEMNDMAALSAADALQGQVSGLDIMAVSGDPGSGSQIVIRGMGSLGNANPLIVVDGIPQDIKVDENFNFGAADQQDLGELLSIAPQDIASVEVLKDAASAAVWGSKGADGVLLIETHKGKSGKILFDYQYKLSAKFQPPPIPMLNGDEYITMQLEEWHNAEGVFDVPREIAYDRDYVDFYNYSANTDWIEEITRDSYTHDHFFKLSGGSDKTKYYTSVNYQKNYGTTINNSFQRFSVRVNFDYWISKKLQFTTNFSYSNTFKEGNAEFEDVNVGGNYYGYDNPLNIRQMAYMKAPNMSVYEYDAEGNPTGDYFNPIENYQGNGVDYFNPVAVGNLSKNDTRGNQIQNNFIFNYNIAYWLKLRETISFQYLNNKTNEFLPYTAIGADWLGWDNNRAQEGNSIDIKLMSRTQAFITPFNFNNNHSLTGVLMWEMEQKQGEWMSLINSRGPSIDITDPASDAPMVWIGSGSSQSRLYGALASINYIYKDKYIVSANMRSDASSVFGENNRWGLFPSVSVGWRFSEESFLENALFINDAKLRLSWGEAGKAPSNPYARHALYETQSQYMEYPTVVPTQIQLVNLRWQTVTTWNAGIDLALLSDRLFINADVYRKLTTDLLWDNYDIAKSSGFNQLKFFNGGELENKGWEYLMRGQVIKRKDLIVELNFNISQNINSFLSFPENFNTERDVTIGNGDYPRKAEVGKPIGSFYGFRFLGVWPSDDDVVARDADGGILTDANGEPLPVRYKEDYIFRGGDAKYDDINKDGQIDIMDAIYIGDSSPEFTGGFGTNIKYKNLSANAHFFYRLGFDIVNQVAIETEGMTNKNNQSKAVLYRWRKQGQDEPGLLPRAYMNHPCNNLGSDRYVEAGDFLRLNSLTIKYRLPSNMAKKLYLRSMDIAINMRKLYTLTNYTGQDPEIGRVGNDPFWMGGDYARTPTPKEYSLSISLGF